ncbi:serine recombinase [Bacillus sp. M6-12]|uniref:recombinase family protein n=1 Tax=Bacillus sp. M6-12 TaxID=2054166 RepID=UPI000C78B3F5|nr:recombinase family protein [Bacillus sp. M6-12]PLS17616.1 serine recombinase [Bacillus sp. M6-12]
MDLTSVLKPGMKGVFYGRHSTQKQNMETQRRRAYELAEKYECKIIGEILDEGVSSRKKDRKGYKKLIADAHSNKFDFVVIYDHKRLARIPEEHDTIRVAMHILEIPIIESETESLYDFGDTVFSAIKDGIAKYELDKIRVNTRNAIESLAKKGLWTGGKAPFGYRYTPKEKGDNGKFEIVDVEMELVKKVFQLYRNNNGFSTIARQMPFKSFRGKEWNKDRVKNIITNPFYAGYISIRRKYENQHNALKPRSEWTVEKSSMVPAVLSIEEWEYLWDIYTNRKERTIPPKHFKTPFLLSSLLVCESCSLKLLGKDQRTTSNQGRVYGKQVYICKPCNYKLDMVDAHSTAFKVFKGYQSVDTEVIIAAIQEEVEKDIALVKGNIVDFEALWNAEKQKLQLCNLEIEKAFLREEKNESLIKVLVITKERLLNKIHQIEQWIEEKKAKMKNLEDIQKNKSIINEQLKHFHSTQSINNEDLRALYLYFFEEILVNDKGHLKCKLRFNLDGDI